MTISADLTLEQARRRLRELGYLNGRVERYLFRRAFEGRGGLLLPAAVVGALAGALAALAAVSSAEPGFVESPRALAALLVHVFAADLLPALVLAFAAGAWADRTRAPGTAAALASLVASGVVFLLWIGGVWGLMREVPASALLWAAPVSIAALWLARNVRSGFLARAFARSRSLPARPRGKILFATAVAGVLAAVGIFSSRRPPEAAPAPRPTPRGAPLVVVGIDGLALDAVPPGRQTGVRAVLARGATGWWPARAASPPEIWMDLATGEPASRHGVRALERVRPAGSPLALRAPLGTGWYLKGIAPRLRLVSTAPVSARDRRSLAFWEVAASAGLPALSVGWWASAPWPGARVFGNEEVLSGATDGLDADRRAIEAFVRESGSAPSVQTIYLPGVDIVRNDPGRRAAAVAQVQRFLEDAVSRAAPLGGAFVVLCADSHPAAGALGRMVVFDGEAPVRTVRIRPEDVAPSLLARAGVPAARDLPGRPVPILFRPGSLDPATVETYGPRVVPALSASTRTDREYLEKLKSLGYLQ